MIRIENVEVYDSDEEIIDVLGRLPNMKEYDWLFRSDRARRFGQMVPL